MQVGYEKIAILDEHPLVDHCWTVACHQRSTVWYRLQHVCVVRLVLQANAAKPRISEFCL